jgi:site-specific recombinase XerD
MKHFEQFFEKRNCSYIKKYISLRLKRWCEVIRIENGKSMETAQTYQKNMNNYHNILKLERKSSRKKIIIISITFFID